MKFFSKSTRGFYDPTIHGEREAMLPDPAWVNPDPEGDPDARPPLTLQPNPDTLIPADAVGITDEQHAALLADQCSGKTIEADADGAPVAVARVVTLEGMRDVVFEEARRMRKDILDALTGIGFRALAAGDAAAAQEAVDAQQALLNITQDPRVLAITVEQGAEALRQTILAVYRERAAQAALSVRTAFQGLSR